MTRSRAFTLVELLVALVVLTTLLAGLAIPLSAQVQMRRLEETRRTLDDAREALLGFAVTAGRLPCPAGAASRGEEQFAPGGDAANGRCASFHDGYLPGATLGLASLDEEGFVRDAWGTPAHRIRYAVFGQAAVEGVEHVLTRAGGMRLAGLAGLGAAPHFLFICASGSGTGAASCGPAANQLTRRAAFVLLSPGPNGSTTTAPGSDEARNIDGDAVFVWRTPSAGPVNAYDDLLTWVPVPVLAGRMVAAGRLP